MHSRSSLLRRASAVVGTLGLLTGMLLAGAPASQAQVRADDTTSTISGTLVEVPGDGQVADAWAVQTAAGAYVPVRFATTQRLTTGERVTVSTRGGLSRVVATLRPLSARVTTGAAQHSYVAILTNPAFGTAPASTSVDSEVTAADAWWARQSGGHIGSFTVAGTVRYSSTVATTANRCGADAAAAVFNEAGASFPDVDFTDPTNHLDIFYAQSSACPVEGLGTEGVLKRWTGGAALMSFHPGSRGTIEHETGHHFGLMHAWGRLCTPATCHDYEYYDLFSVMGLALENASGAAYEPASLDTPYRVAEGITDPGEVTNLSLRAGPLAVVRRTVLPRSGTTGVRALAVRDPRTGQTYYVSFRAGGGTDDAGACYTTGRCLATAPTTNRLLLSYRPGVTVDQLRSGSGVTAMSRSVRGVFDFDFTAGTSYTSRSGGMTVTVNSTSPTRGAIVTVTLRAVPHLTRHPVPRIVGRAEVGGRLTAKHGTWDSGVRFRYHWYADGKAIRNADHPTYKVTAAVRHERITVRVTGSKPGFSALSRTSKATRKVG